MISTQGVSFSLRHAADCQFRNHYLFFTVFLYTSVYVPLIQSQNKAVFRDSKILSCVTNACNIQEEFERSRLKFEKEVFKPNPFTKRSVANLAEIGPKRISRETCYCCAADDDNLIWFVASKLRTLCTIDILGIPQHRSSDSH